MGSGNSSDNGGDIAVKEGAVFEVSVAMICGETVGARIGFGALPTCCECVYIEYWQGSRRTLLPDIGTLIYLIRKRLILISVMVFRWRVSIINITTMIKSINLT